MSCHVTQHKPLQGFKPGVPVWQVHTYFSFMYVALEIAHLSRPYSTVWMATVVQILAQSLLFGSPMPPVLVIICFTEFINLIPY